VSRRSVPDLPRAQDWSAMVDLYEAMPAAPGAASSCASSSRLRTNRGTEGARQPDRRRALELLEDVSSSRGRAPETCGDRTGLQGSVELHCEGRNAIDARGFSAKRSRPIAAASRPIP